MVDFECINVRLLYSFFGDVTFLNAPPFLRKNDVIVVAMTSGKWMVLDSQTREVYGVFQDGREPIQAAKFSPNGKLLALGSHDGIIYMYSMYTFMAAC